MWPEICRRGGDGQNTLDNENIERNSERRSAVEKMSQFSSMATLLWPSADP
jgi:hypothetical protein